MSSRPLLTRRGLLRTVAVTALAAPVAAACGPGYDDSPDQLLPLLRRARADAAAANALARSSADVAELARQVATARTAQADALQQEVDRLNKPRPEGGNAPPETVRDLSALGERLAQARTQAAELVPRLPAYRAGLTGSVAAGCAAVQQLAPSLGAEQPGTVDVPSTGELTPEAVGALQQALAAEHAAMWVYGLVSAFLPADYAAGIDNGTDAHRDRRDACERVLTAAGVTPRPPEAAYVPPEPVRGEDAAVQLVVTAETDAANAWHGVLERTGDAGLRRLATQALIGSATRCTSWRIEAGRQPAALALPGRATGTD
ncbi:ferritin-like domain-containing protein [Prauserella muralis]|uniref:Uncharacterized protein n=1 Tax=Prauserella muralis TaxID=588067 RepID=A0A2V4B4A2_9PSEU|nr:ferritin-like domain-containing protein [Prauserella muralis]PXY27965.1 hypothetical protein BAY60_16595 [Prauserella muralis]TWE22247.1 uncharacterized protein DUF4439 [Prauserella muralis]